MFIEVLIVVKFSNIFFLSFSFSMNFIESILQLCRPQNSPRQLATAEGFAEANSVFIIITSTKILLRWLFPSKIYIQFTTFNTYFSLLLLFKWLLRNKRYHLHVLEKCLYVLQEVSSIVYFLQFIHPLSLHSRGNEVLNSCSNVLISMTLFGKKKRMPKFGHMP